MILSIKNYILDILMVLGASISTMSLIGGFTLNFVKLPASSSWFIFTIACYILRFGFKVPNMKWVMKQPLLKLFLIIILWEAIQALLWFHPISFTYFVELISYFIIAAYFLNVTHYYKDIQNITRPYCYYLIYSFLIVIATAVLIAIGILSPTENAIEENSLMQSNIDSGTFYFWPGYLSIVTAGKRIVLYEGLPVLCGLCHEPHVFGLTVFPAFFLLLYFLRNYVSIKIIFYIILFFVFLLTFSTTSLICLAIVFFMEYVYGASRTKKYRVLKIVIPIFTILIAMVVLLSTTDIIDQISNVVLKKTGGSESSKDYSYSLLSYTLLPNGVLGDGIYPREQGMKSFLNSNVGLISALLFISYYVLFFVKSYKSFVSRRTISHYIGLATLYFFIHSLKLGCLIFNYPLMFYMAFILSCSDYLRNNKVNIKKTQYEKTI